MKPAELEESLSLETRVSNLLHLNHYSQLSILTDIPLNKCIAFCYNFRECGAKYILAVKDFPEKVFDHRASWEKYVLQAVKEVVNEMQAHD